MRNTAACRFQGVVDNRRFEAVLPAFKAGALGVGIGLMRHAGRFGLRRGVGLAGVTSGMCVRDCKKGHRGDWTGWGEGTAYA